MQEACSKDVSPGTGLLGLSGIADPAARNSYLERAVLTSETGVGTCDCIR